MWRISREHINVFLLDDRLWSRFALCFLLTLNGTLGRGCDTKFVLPAEKHHLRSQIIA